MTHKKKIFMAGLKFDKEQQSYNNILDKMEHLIRGAARELKKNNILKEGEN